MDAKQKLLEVKRELAKSELELTRLQTNFFKSIPNPFGKNNTDPPEEKLSRIIRDKIDRSVQHFTPTDHIFENWPTFDPKPDKIFRFNYRGSVNVYLLFFTSTPRFSVITSNDPRLSQKGQVVKVHVHPIPNIEISDDVMDDLEPHLYFHCSPPGASHS